MLWAEIFDADESRVAGATGPILLTSATFSRVLDGVGQFSIDMPLTDERVTQVQSLKRCYIYTDMPAYKLIGAGIITRISKRMTSSGWTLSADGPDLMDELKQENTLLARKYSVQAATAILDSLVNIATIWDLHIIGTATVQSTARFDGASVLKAMQTVCEQTGLHFRYVNNRLIECGYFGTWNGINLISPDAATADSPYIALIDSLSVTEESEDIVNWIQPVGSGEGEASLTLQYVAQDAVLGLEAVNNTQTVTFNGKTQYYVTDADSIALYGTRKKVVKFDVSPIDNSGAGKAQGSNQLYVAAREYLNKNSDPQVSYAVTVRNLTGDLMPGDKVRLLYFGPIKRDDGTEVPGERIDKLLWITKIEQRLGQEDTTWTLTVSNIDRHAVTEVDVVANQIEDAKVRTLKPGTVPSVFTYSQNDACSHVKPAVFFLNVNSTITEILSVTLRLTTGPIWAPFWFQYDNALPGIRGYFTPYQATFYPLMNAYYNNDVFIEQFAFGVGDRNAAYSVEYDVTSYIRNHTPTSAGHKFQVYDVVQSLSGVSLTPYIPAANNGPSGTVDVSGGMIYATFTVLAVTQAI